MRVGLIQMCSSDDPGENLVTVSEMIGTAASEGAEFVLTPEVTNCVSASRKHQAEVLTVEDDDRTLAMLRGEAAMQKIWLLIGSLALKGERDERFVNRSFLIAPNGEIVARYDKIHMFDVEVTPEETYRESDGYRPGTRAVLEGVAFALADCRDALAATGTSIESCVAVGGGTKSDYWLAAVATALDIPLDIPVGGDFGAAFGASPAFRISYAEADDVLSEALSRIQTFCAGLS